VADSPRIEELRRRVQSDPASIAFAALAEEYRRAGRFEEAIETCTAGLIRHPSYLSAHVTLGRALVEVGRLEDARNELEYVLRLAPENLAAIRALAEIHDQLGEGSHGPAAKSQAPEAAAPEMIVAEIHAASGFSHTAAEETAPFFTPAPVEPEPVKPPVSPTWEPEPVTPPAPLPWEVEPFAPSVAATLEAEPAPSYSPISMEETPAPEAPPVLASVSHVHQPPADESVLVSHDSAQGGPFDPSTSSGSFRAESRDDSAEGRPQSGPVTRLEEFLQAILRSRAERGASR
jgi:hypothetical protein